MIPNSLLLPIAAPSGTGKTTVCRELLKLGDQFEFSISCTTRKIRENEKNGKDYYFVAKKDFEYYIKNNKLVEWEKVFENYYGTLKSTIIHALSNQKVLLLDIDVKGALSIKELFPDDTTTIFLEPPSQEELIKRLNKRNTDDEKSISIRNARIPIEMKYKEKFDYTIINDKLDETINQLQKIIKEKCNNG